MSGPDILIGTPEPVPRAVLEDITAYLTGVCDRPATLQPDTSFETDIWDVQVRLARLGLVGPWPDSASSDSCRITVCIDGAGHGDGCDGWYEQGQFSEVSEYLLPLLGFTPANILCVLAWASRQPDHLSVARLSADLVDLTGGVAVVSLYDHQVDTVRRLPGVRAMDVDEDGAYAAGGSTFLRAFTVTAGFRLLK